MAVRSTIQYIIDHVRDLINDREPDGHFTDEQIQTRLDLSRLDRYAAPLNAASTISNTGDIEFKHFFANPNFWEETVVLQLRDGTTFEVDTDYTADYMLGNFVFTEAPTDRVYLTGSVFDVYGAASKLLIQMESELRSQFNFTVDGMTVQRIAQISDIRSQSVAYAGMAWPKTLKMVRQDENWRGRLYRDGGLSGCW